MMTPEEAEFFKKNTDFKNYQFPEVNPVKYQRKDVSSNQMITLQNYRYPAVGERKGTVQFIHGYGDYTARYAFIGQKFAENGYDFIGIDQRGFGNSEGKRGIFEDWKTVIEDQLEFSYLCDKQFGTTDRFINSVSLGGMIALDLVAE